MKKHYMCLTILMFLLSSVLAFAQDKDEAKYYYVGKIGDETSIYQLSVQMEILVEGSDIRGSFYYEQGGNKGGAVRSLLGQINSNESTINLVVRGEGGNLKARGPLSNKEGDINAKFTPINGGLGTTINGTYLDKVTSEKLPIKLTKVANYDFSIIKQGKYSEAKWSYPLLISDNEVLQKVSVKLRDRMKPQIEEYQKDAKEGFMTDVITSTWLFTYDYSIEYYSEELISFTGQVYSYTGGAHGNTYFVSSNYSIKDGDSKLLKLSDLFKEKTDYVSVISDLIIKDLKKQKAGWVVNGEITSLKEDEIGPFALSPRGIQFAFAPYAVGPYSDGAFFVTINYVQLKGIINPKGTLSQFMGQNNSNPQNSGK
ncbi:MAG: hypothetical protein DHS20C13_13700 [Thermodesulfobacteriota bacterium]|nr:MAG: hypothetical protein DHS20C13_13700 [Thermodesulfobacteriota bacterium]